MTTDTHTATARYLCDDKTVKVVHLKRHGSDQHDMKKLVAYAVQKLIKDDGNIIDVRPAGYQGAVCVVASNNKALTNGRILEFVSGWCTNWPPLMNISHIPLCFDDFADLKAWAVKNHFDIVELHRH